MDVRPSLRHSSLRSRALVVLRNVIPLVTCLLFIPLLLIFSLWAGYLVWTNVAVTWHTPVYLQYGDGLPPYADLRLSQLTPKQPYDISLHLNVPTTDSNLALGNFMASLTLFTPSNKTLLSVRRPALVTPPKASRFSLFGSSRPPTTSLHIQLLSEFTPAASTVIAKLEVGRKDQWTSLGNGQGRELSVIDASLKGVVRHAGFRGLGTRFPLIFAISASITFLSISSLMLVACLVPLFGTGRSRVPKSDDVVVKVEEDVVVVEEKPRPPSPPPSYKPDLDSDDMSRSPRRRRRSGKSRSSSSRSGQATDENASGSIPLRRRRSRLYDADE